MNKNTIFKIASLHFDCSKHLHDSLFADTEAKRSAARDAYVTAAMEINKIHFKKLFAITAPGPVDVRKEERDYESEIYRAEEKEFNKSFMD